MAPPPTVSHPVLALPEPRFGLAADNLSDDLPRAAILEDVREPEGPLGDFDSAAAISQGMAAIRMVEAAGAMSASLARTPVRSADNSAEVVAQPVARTGIEAALAQSDDTGSDDPSEAPGPKLATVSGPADQEQVTRSKLPAGQKAIAIEALEAERLEPVPEPILRPLRDLPSVETRPRLASNTAHQVSPALPSAQAHQQDVRRARSLPRRDTQLLPSDARSPAGLNAQPEPVALSDDARIEERTEGARAAGAREIEAEPQGSAPSATQTSTRSAGSFDYRSLPQARQRPGVSSLLPKQAGKDRTSIFGATTQAAKRVEGNAPAASESDPAMAQLQQPDFTPGRQTFPSREGSPPFTYEDELILQIQVVGIPVNDTIIAYGNRDGVYLPLGEMGRILDLAIRVSDDGHYASGWFLSEDRTLTIDLRNDTLSTAAGTRPLPPGYAVAFDGELFLRAEGFGDLLPLKVEPNLRAQRILLTTLEPFPFEERMKRDSERARLNARNALPDQVRWPREETPYLPFSVPLADIELRAVSDVVRGTRAEGDLRLAGDLAWMTAQSYLSASTRDGLVAALLELGRRDPDGELLGPMRATEFQLGDVSTSSMSVGLRGAAGRGLSITNQPFESVSVFDRIDLRGVLPDGYEVELYRNDILLGSTRETVNGQYEFLEVPVDYGLNVFRLVFYGPQGQRREEVRKVSVGDGRLASGQLVYSLGALQRGVNLLGVTGPDFRPGDRYGDWQGIAEVAYGVTPALTAVVNAALFEDEGKERWLAGLGLRSGIAGYAIRADAGFSDGGGHAVGLGVGGRALNGAFTLSHFEYGGGFIDETRAFTSQAMNRSTQFDFNTSLNLGGAISGTYLPISLRGRHLEFSNGQKQTNASLRGSMRFPGLIASSTLEYSRNESLFGATLNQLFGNFDLATFNRSDLQLRGSLGYRVAPDPEITTVTAEANYAFDDRTVVRGSVGYSFLGEDVSLGLSAIRDFERFSLALDGRYRVKENDFAVVARLGFSLGRDPKRGRVFVHRPGLASSGAISARVFHDVDGDGVYGTQDKLLPGVALAVYNNTAESDEDGIATLGQLGDGSRVSVQIDPSTLPDLLMAPVNRGIEIVPRAGRIHQTDFAVVELSEVEGNVTFGDDGNGRGVSGLRLQLRNAGGEPQHFVRTERGGYYFFEEVKPGTYEIIIDPEQAERLGICLGSAERVTILPTGDTVSRDLEVRSCEVGKETAGHGSAASRSEISLEMAR